MPARKLPSQDELKRLFDYDADTGRLLNRVKRNSRTPIGSEAGSLHKVTGYRRVYIAQSQYLQHRVIWKLVHGVDPNVIDHINGDTTDNRIENLRDVDQSTNGLNRHTPPHSNSGVRGVSWESRQRRWNVSHGDVRLGNFKSLLDAVAARYRAERFA